MSSSSLEQNVVQRFTRVNALTKVDKKSSRASCDYDLHDHCATCPYTLLSFLHPQHELQLFYNGPDQLMCSICQGLVEGTYYHCEACGVDIHPLCTKQRQFMRYMPHPAHILELSQCGTSSTCMVCQGAIFSWRYKCDPCLVNVHVECVNSSAPAALAIPSAIVELKPATSIQQKSIELQPCDQECGHTNKSEGEVPGPSKRSKRRRVARFMTDLTVEIVCTIVNETLLC